MIELYGNFESLMLIGNGWCPFWKMDFCDREGKWARSIAVGTQGFVEKTKQKLGIRAKGRKIIETEEACQLREP